jgi:hypothetical protein
MAINEEDKKIQEEINKLLTERAVLESEILELKKKINSQESKNSSELKKILELEAIRTGSIEKEEELREKLKKIGEDDLKREERRKKLQKESEDTRVKSQKETEKFNQKEKESQESREKLEKDLASKVTAVLSIKKELLQTDDKTKAVLATMPAEIQKQASALGLSANMTDDITYGLTQAATAIQSGTKFNEGFTDQLQKNGDLAASFQEMTRKTVIAIEDANNGKEASIDLSELEKTLALERYKIQNQMGDLTDDERQMLLNQLEPMQQRLDILKKAKEEVEKTSSKMGILNDVSSKVGTTMSSWVTKLPGGDKISKVLGIEKTAEKMNKHFGDALSKGLSGNFKEAFSSGIKGLGSMISMAPKLLAALGIGLIIGAFSFLLDTLGKIDSEVAEIGREFGISRKEAFALRDASVDIAKEMNLVGINSKEVVKGISTASKLMNGIDMGARLASGNAAAKQLVKDTTVLSEKFGLSEDEIKSIHDISIMSGKSMGELTKEATTLGKGIMTSKEALKTLAKIPKEVTVAFKGSTQELIKAAQKAQALGKNLKEIQGIGDGMLDVEQSLQKEMEARAITGKNLQLDAARMYALQGDTAKLQDELLKQAGSLADFQKMNRLQQKSFADAMGMSVEEMTDLLTNAEKLKTLGISQEKMGKLQSMNAKELNAELAKGGKQELQDYIKTLAKEKESAEIKQRMSDVLTKIQEQLSKILTPVLEMLHGMLDTAMATGQIDGLLAGIKGVISGIIPVVKVVFSIFGGILGFVTPIFKTLFATEEKTGEVKAGFSSILPVLAGIGLYFGGKGILMKGMGMLKDGAIDAGKAILSSVGSAVKSVGSKMADVGKAGASKVAAIGKGAAGKVGGMASKVAGKMKLPGKMGGMLGKAAKVGGKAAGAAGSAAPSPIASLAEQLQNLDGKKLMQIAAAILVLSASLWVAAKGFQEMAKVDWAKAWIGVTIFVLIVAALVGVAMLLKDPLTLAVLGSLSLVMVALGASLLLAAVGFKIMGEVKWDNFKGIAMALIELAAGFAVLGAAAGLIILGSAAMVVMGAAAMAFGAGLYIIAKALAEFQKIGDFGKVGENLAAGMQALAGVADKIDLGKLEDAFEDLQDALEELDFKQLAAFAQLGGASMAQAGSNLVAGINSLMGINQNINWGGLEDTFQDLTNSFEELDLEAVQAFAELGNDKLKSAGVNLLAGINSLAMIDPRKAAEFLGPFEDMFSKIEDVFDELDYEDLDGFMKIDFAKLGANTKNLDMFVKTLSSISSVSGLDKLEDQFEKLSDAIDELDIDKLNDLSNIKADAMKNMVSLRTVFQPTESVESKKTSGGAGAASEGAGGMSVNFANIEKKLDTLISVMSSAANQPTVIKFGDKTIEEIKTQLNFKKAYNISVDNSYGRSI